MASKALTRRNRGDFDSWLRRMLAGEEDDRCVSLSINHVVGSGKLGDQLGMIRVKPEHDLETLISGVIDRCLQDATAIGGMQKYHILALNSEKEQIDRFIFRVEGRANPDDNDDIDSEPPTKTGFMAQMMREHGMMFRTTIGALGNIIRTQDERLEKLENKLDKLIDTTFDKQVEILDTIEALQTKGHERALEQKKADANLEFKRTIMGELKLLMPIIMSKFTGGVISKSARNTPEFQLLGRILDNLKLEQIQPALDQFTDAQRLAFFELYEMHIKSKEAEAASQKPSNGTNGGGKPS